MKKIVWGLILMLGLTACGNNALQKDNEAEENQTVNVDVSSENNDMLNKEEMAEELIQTISENTEQSKSEEDHTIEEKEESNEEVLTPPEPETVYEDGVEIGKKAVDFEIELLSGERVKLSDYIGKPVFLNFWATWCGPCVGEMPDIQKVNDEYGDKIIILAVNGGELKEDVQAFIDKKGYTFNIGLNEDGDILDTYDSMYIPLSVFIDENGIIKERKVGALSKDEMEKIVKDLLSGK